MLEVVCDGCGKVTKDEYELDHIWHTKKVGGETTDYHCDFCEDCLLDILSEYLHMEVDDG